ncbi:FeoA family protein [Campylobacter peloridis]|uniref:Ferrous iron transport protein A n=1 Tax=Campylobacter peloridis TaxID=488546 RepID=A0A5C7DQT6_9BACT|nr:ferrous iron transport protein A [Campylobacter peloridis]AJC84164.1 ferrous iron transport protein A [Campylobacter peloridis LMG 23910]MBX1885385.1 ferrous iron transport protein A [Campylobacter peloridis]MBX2079105.1 ferrous iron transport protein A [Campylobacter peloridis]QOQ88265.1 ferrous iron transport protein A [Campylobacter peloridis]TXE83651.1 ferrous iron transport protein A [Campylobacter peloridis]
MTLDTLKDNEEAIIIGFKADKQLQARLFSFGFAKNKKIKKIRSSMANSTIMVELEASCVILRASEAKAIEIAKELK